MAKAIKPKTEVAEGEQSTNEVEQTTEPKSFFGRFVTEIEAIEETNREIKLAKEDILKSLESVKSMLSFVAKAQTDMLKK